MVWAQLAAGPARGVDVDPQALARACGKTGRFARWADEAIIEWTVHELQRERLRGGTTPQWAVEIVDVIAGRTRTQSQALAPALAWTGRPEQAGARIADRVERSPSWYPNLPDGEPETTEALAAAAIELRASAGAVPPGAPGTRAAWTEQLIGPILKAMGARPETLSPAGEKALHEAITATWATAGDAARGAALAAVHEAMRRSTGIRPGTIAAVARIEHEDHGAVSATTRAAAGGNLAAWMAIAQHQAASARPSDDAARETLRLLGTAEPADQGCETAALATALLARIADAGANHETLIERKLLEQIVARRGGLRGRARITLARIDAQYHESLLDDDEGACARYAEAIAVWAGSDNQWRFETPEWTPEPIGRTPPRTANAIEAWAGSDLEAMGWNDRVRGVSALAKLIEDTLKGAAAAHAYVRLYTCEAPSDGQIRLLAGALKALRERETG